MTSPAPLIPLDPYRPDDGPAEASRRFYEIMRRRRSVRMFSDRPVDRVVIENVIRTAGSAPSGANKQPWRFVAVQDPSLKREIRIAAEDEERAFYERRASEDWLADLAVLGTDDHKPFIETAPWLIVVFKIMKDDQENRLTDLVYYVNESVGLACGMLLAAIHNAGLASLTHTPSPMKFLGKILGRPAYERPFLLIPVGWPADNCMVPDIQRKPLDEIMVVDAPMRTREDGAA